MVQQLKIRCSVKGRMTTGQGINFAEFTYQLLQSYDFWHLYNHKNCRLQVSSLSFPLHFILNPPQIGGNDQFGNITAGIDLISKLKPPTPNDPPTDFDPAYGLTVPLLTTPSGAKFGKSAGNAVWLDPTLTLPFELYQFFVRLPDAVVGSYLKMFTLLPIPTITEVLASYAAVPEKRGAQHMLAQEVVMLIHGGEAAKRAEMQTRLLFPAPGETAKFTVGEIVDGFGEGVVEVPRSEVVGEFVTKVARRVGAVKTKGEAENMVRGGGVYVGLGNERVGDVKTRVEERMLVGGEVLVLRTGKGRFIIVRAMKEGGGSD